MLAFVSADGNLPFAAALALMIAFALLEGCGALVGMTFSKVIDSLLPEGLGDVDMGIDIDADLDVDADLDIDADADLDLAGLDRVEAVASTPLRILGWLCVGRVPILVLLVIFLTVFGLAGFAVQGTALALSGMTLPGIVAAVPALFVAIPCVRLFGSWLAKVMPKEETSAVSRKSFIGAIAVIIRGHARPGEPAEAKFSDAHGQVHYVLVEPDLDDESFAAGDEVLLVRQIGSKFTAIANTNPALSPNKDG